MLLIPLLLGAAMFFLLLAGLGALQNQFPRNQWDMEAIDWGRPPPSLRERWRTKIGKIRCRLPESAKPRMPEIAPKPAPQAPATASGPLKQPAHADPVKKAAPPLFPLFGAPNGRLKEGFVWEETKGIE
jgi:hypothetical protein